MLLQWMLVGSFLLFHYCNANEARCTTSGDRCALPFNYKGEVYKSCTDIFSITGTLMCPFQFNGRIGVGECTICQGPGMCYIKADFLKGLPFTMYCPSSCNSVTNRLYGSPNIYSEDSYVCAAGLHSGRVRGSGALITAEPLTSRPSISLTGTTRNNIRSNPRVIPTKLMQIISPAARDNLPRIFFSHMSNVEVLPAGRNEPVVLVDDRSKAIALDVDVRRQVVYFSDVVKREVVRAQLSVVPIPTSRQTVILDKQKVLLPDGLAIDWIHDNLYWTDANFNQVMVSESNGQHILTLVKRGPDFKPRAIVLDPRNGLMFISNWGTPATIEKCSMADGSTCQVIVNTNIVWPNGMSYDFQDGRLYWVDAKEKSLSSCLPDGSDTRIISKDQRLFNHPYALSILGNRAYWSDWGTKAILSVDKLTGRKPRIIASNVVSGAGIKATDSNVQPQTPNRCENSGCGFLCLASPGGYRCKCPDGFDPVMSDESRCTEAPTVPPPPGTVLQMLVADILFVKKLEYNFEYVYGEVTNVATDQKNAVALTSYVQNNTVYWSDVRSNALMKTSYNDDVLPTVYLQGNSQSSLLRHPDGIAVDWIYNNLYWSDYELHSVFVTKLTEHFTEGTKIIQRTPFSLLRALALHPGKGFMFISDWGFQPKIERCWMNGENCIDIANINMGWPNGIAIDFESDRLYWADAKLKTVTYSNFDGSGRTLLIQNPAILPHPYAIAVSFNKVFWSDWRLKQIIRADKNTGDDRFVVVKNLLKPMGLEIVSEGSQPYFPNKCLPNSCSHICVPIPTSGAFEDTSGWCLCPTYPENTDCVQSQVTTSPSIECPPGMTENSDLSDCQDIDECSHNNDVCHHNCVNTIGSFYCSCRSGFEMNVEGTQCTQTDPCESSPCLNGGICSALNQENFLCTCLQGFGDEDCSRVNGTIVQSINPIPEGSSFILECRIPLSVRSSIIWRLNRKLVNNGLDHIVVFNSGRMLSVLRATIFQAGEYSCQFQHNGAEFAVHHMVAVDVPAEEICGKAVGINDKSRKRVGRIYGGSATRRNHAPFMAFLYKMENEPYIVPSGLFCGASIISKTKIVTAAHCVQHLLPHHFKVYVGKLKGSAELFEKFQQILDVSRIIMYTDYISKTFHGDIAILELEKPMVFTLGVKPICVPASDDQDEELKPRPSSSSTPKQGMIFGWGLKSASRGSRVLREVVLPIRPMSYCHEAFNTVTSLMFCAGGGSIQDACYGDSGGPFALWSTSQQRWSLAGIISWGEGCGNPSKPGVYTRVGKSIRDWLHKNIE